MTRPATDGPAGAASPSWPRLGPLGRDSGDLDSRQWSVPVPSHQGLLCQGHGQGEDVFLCASCLEAATAMLTDLPALLADLEVALTRQVEFLDGMTSEDDGDESPLPYDPRARRAVSHLALAIDTPAKEHATSAQIMDRADQLLEWLPKMLALPGVVGLVDRLALAVAYAHWVIERPPEPWYYGACPKCQADLYDERDVEAVQCAGCGYAAKVADHRLACLDAGEDRWLTVAELVGAITRAGEQVTRRQINGWIERDGLAREKGNRPVWKDGVSEDRFVYVYRLGDVRLRALLGDRRHKPAA